MISQKKKKKCSKIHERKGKGRQGDLEIDAHALLVCRVQEPSTASVMSQTGSQVINKTVPLCPVYFKEQLRGIIT